jgi:O-acetyl-ADP-ribose deacetylase (regulator of RNase III)
MKEHRTGRTRLTLVRGDITEQRVDAIVNAANPTLLGGGGVDGAIHRKGGQSIVEECRIIRRDRHPDGLPTGEAVVTTAGKLPARHVIHTVGPIWRGGDGGEAEQLSNAYRNSLLRAQEAGAKSVAFPSISTGAYGYPVRHAAHIALHTVLHVLSETEGIFDEVRFALFSEEDLAVYETALAELIEA